MKQTACLLLLAMTIAGCVSRISPFSPRRPNTEAHRQATSNADCIGCHDISKLPHHAKSDDCMLCHKIAFGGVQ